MKLPSHCYQDSDIFERSVLKEKQRVSESLYLVVQRVQFEEYQLVPLDWDFDLVYSLLDFAKFGIGRAVARAVFVGRPAGRQDSRPIGQPAGRPTTA